MSDLLVNADVNLKGNFARRARRYARTFDKFGSSAKKTLIAMQRNIIGLSNGLDKLGNRYTGLVTGGAGLLVVRNIGNFGERIERIGIQANRSKEYMEKLKEKIFETANAPDIRVDPDQVTDAIAQIIEMTGDLTFAEDNIRNIGLMIQATGAQGTAVGGVLSEFQKMDIKSPDQVLKAIDTLNKQGKEGAFTLENLAALGPRVITAYTSTGRGGVEALKEMGAVLQVIRQGTGSSEMAATAFEAMMNTLSNKSKLDKLVKAGIQIFDPEALKNKQKILRPINLIMKEIVEAAHGQKTLIGSIFDAEAIRAFNSSLAEFNRTGSVKGIEKFIAITGDGQETAKDSARAAGTFNAAIQSLTTSFEKIADSNLAGPIQSFADAVNSMSPARIDAIITRVAKLAMILGGLVVANKVARGFRALNAIRPNALGVAGKSGAAKYGGATPVYVINMGSGNGSGAIIDTEPGGKKTGKKLSKRGARWNRYGGVSAKGAGIAMAGLSLADTWMSDAPLDDKIIDTASTGGGLAGGWAGAEAGALVGSFAGPIGTAIGAAIGGGIGYFAGSKLTGFLAEWLTGKDKDVAEKMMKAADKMEAAAGKESRLSIDVKGPARVSGMSGNSRMRANTGLLMADIGG